MSNEMISEELKAKLAAVTSVEDTYKLACEEGFTGTYEEYAALVTKAEEKIAASMSMDDMEQVAGGNVIGDAWDATKSGFSKGLDWVKANPYLTAEIVGGVVTVGTIVGVTAYTLRSRRTPDTYGERTSVSSNGSNGSNVSDGHIDKLEGSVWTRHYPDGTSELLFPEKPAVPFMNFD